MVSGNKGTFSIKRNLFIETFYMTLHSTLVISQPSAIISPQQKICVQQLLNQTSSTANNQDWNQVISNSASVSNHMAAYEDK